MRNGRGSKSDMAYWTSSCSKRANTSRAWAPFAFGKKHTSLSAVASPPFDVIMPLSSLPFPPLSQIPTPATSLLPLPGTSVDAIRLSHPLSSHRPARANLRLLPPVYFLFLLNQLPHPPFFFKKPALTSALISSSTEPCTPRDSR